MITFENKYEETELNEFKSLGAGGQVIIIKSASQYAGPSGMSLKIEIDIAEGDFKGMYQEKYDKDDRPEKKWNNNATKYVSLKPENERFVFALITALERSNPGVKFTSNVNGTDVFDESKIVGKLCGGEFGLKEYRNSEQELRTVAEFQNFRDKNKVKDIKMPSVKVINGMNSAGYDTYDYVDYEEYMNKPKQNSIDSNFGDLVNEATIDLDDADLD